MCDLGCVLTSLILGLNVDAPHAERTQRPLLSRKHLAHFALSTCSKAALAFFTVDRFVVEATRVSRKVGGSCPF